MSISWLGFLAKLVPYVGQLDDLAEAAERLLQASGLQELWDATKALGDILVPILSSVTGLSFEDEAQAIVALGLGDAVMGSLRRLFDSERFQSLLTTLLFQLIKG